jgi:hypothetical protein
MSKILSSKSYRINIHHRLPVRVQWRYLGQHGARWFEQLDWATGDPIEFATVEEAEEWIRKRREG